MEYVEGEALSSALKGGPLDRRRVAAIARDLGSALDYAHDSGVVTATSSRRTCCWRGGITKLVDLGIATAVDQTRITHRERSSERPPTWRRSSSRGEIGPYTDIYALAAFSTRLFPGVPPGPGEHRSRSPTGSQLRILPTGATSCRRSPWQLAQQLRARHGARPRRSPLLGRRARARAHSLTGQALGGGKGPRRACHSAQGRDELPSRSPSGRLPVSPAARCGSGPLARGSERAPPDCRATRVDPRGASRRRL